MRRRRPTFRPGVEGLETRELPAAGLAEPLAALPGPPALAGAAGLVAAPQAVVTTVSGLTPAQVRRAYGFDKVAGDGSGQTIAIVTAYAAPNLAQDLAVFSRTFGLPDPPALAQAAPQGAPAVNPTWALETSLDVQWAHALAPGARLLVVQARSAELLDLLGAVDYARQQPGVSVVSMSWGFAEFSAESYFDSHFTAPAGHAPGGVTFVAATGDKGAGAGLLWPSVSPKVLAVGGTQVTVDPFGNVVAETAWSGGGGGASPHVSSPAAQAAVSGRAARTTPDVAFNAASASAFAVYCSTPVNGQSGWFRLSGTSAATPAWAALVALANQARAAAGQGPLTDAVGRIYALPASAFRDITTGSNGLAAGPGYDLATGRGVPVADRVVRGLVDAAPPAPVTPPAAPPPVTPPVTPPAPPPVTPTTPAVKPITVKPSFLAASIQQFGASSAAATAASLALAQRSVASAVKVPSGAVPALAAVPAAATPPAPTAAAPAVRPAAVLASLTPAVQASLKKAVRTFTL